MKKLTYALSALVCATSSIPAFAEEIRFVSCPIYRDTDSGAKSGCWLANNPESGVRYDISISNVKPDWNYGVLVEGITTGVESDACSGEVLEPVSVSVLTDIDCTRYMLPAEGYPGRPFVRPETFLTPLLVDREPPAPPFDDRTFSVMFEFDRNFIVYQHGDYYFDQAVYWIRGTNPSRIVVTGYADTEERVVSGMPLHESDDAAQRRAERVAFNLRRMGVPDDILEVRWTDEVSEDLSVMGAYGVAAPTRRRVDIEVFQ